MTPTVYIARRCALATWAAAVVALLLGLARHEVAAAVCIAEALAFAGLVALGVANNERTDQ